MFDLSLVQSLGTMIILATILVLLLRRLFIPNIVAYIFAGLAITSFKSFIEIILPGEFSGTDIAGLSIIKTISEVGIALLLFIVGLELSLDKVKDTGKVAILAGLGQVIFTAIGGYFLSILLGFSNIESLFISVALTFSSTVVVVKLLDQKKELSSQYGRISVGIFLVQDMVVIFVLTVLGGITQGDSSVEISSVIINISKALFYVSVLLVLALASSKWALSPIFEWAANRSTELLFFLALLWCFSFVLLAELFHLSVEVGAFLAGLSLAQPKCSEDLHRRVKPLMNFFIAIFFVSLGAQMEFGAAKEYMLPATILSLFVLIGNPLIFIWIIAAMRYPRKTAFLTSVTVAQISEFSFIFAAMGLSSGLINSSILSLIALIGLTTIAISSYMIIYNHELYSLFQNYGLLSWVPGEHLPEEKNLEKLKHHILIIGINSLARNIVRELTNRGETVLVIDTDPRKLRKLNCLTMVGNVSYLSVLEEAGYENAKLVISTLTIEDVNLLLAFRCRQQNIPVAIHAFDGGIISDLESLKIDYIINSKSISSFELGKLIHQISIKTQAPEPC
ncbi:MAG TPA: cation:proton antiporter [Oligoflexia bacterium]|nr:cation:proton antiporter [Oligoflexia bacterium]HMP47343.1 cation:proton antiporter [Oligoflexia bacterium]